MERTEPEEIRYLLGTTIAMRAERCWKQRQVGKITERRNRDGVRQLDAQVQGTMLYDVRVWLRANGSFVNAECSCPYNCNGDGALCKHIGAVLFADNAAATADSARTARPGDIPGVMRGGDYAAQHAARRDSYTSSLEMLFGKKWHTNTVQSDYAAQNLLDEYMHEPLTAQQTAMQQREFVELTPELRLEEDSLAQLRLYIQDINQGRRYVVKSIQAMLDAIDKGENYTYGKKLAFIHRQDAFTPDAQKLLAIVRRQMSAKKYLDEANRQAGDWSASVGNASAAGSIYLSGEILDTLFDTYLAGGAFGGYWLFEGAPEMKLHVEKKRGGAQLALTPALGTVQGMDYAYLFHNDENTSSLWRLNKAELARLSPAISALGGKSVFFTRKDAEAFCSYVLPELGNKVEIDDPDRLLLDRIPLEPIVRFYLDLPEEMHVTVRPEFAYGEEIVTPDGAPIGLLRNDRAERRAARLLESTLTPVRRDRSPTEYEAAGEEDVCRFLDEGVPALLGAGEVYLSDAFRRLQAAPPRVSVGVSVQGSVLDLDVDTGEFPIDELRELIGSMRQKKRYHRLRDGRLLRLDDSMRELEELDETLELAGAQLENGHTTLPLYRAPSLDRAMAGQNTVSFNRDDAFRQISRNFHAVQDSEYTLPPSLQKVLRKYQRDGYRWLRTLDGYGMGGILADDMGLGKTLQVLTYLLALKQGGQSLPSLIVCPASLVLNWQQECEKFTPELKCLPIDGTASRRAGLAARLTDVDIVVTSYDLLRRDVERYAEQEFYACILDEAQAIKNHSTQKYRAVCRVKSRVRFALTGTPVENRLSELWSIFSFLMPGYLPPHKKFIEKFEKPILLEKDENAIRRLNQLTGPFILRRMKSEVLKELPPKTENTYRVSLGREQRKLYLAAVLDAKEKLRAAKPEDRVAGFAVLMRLRQICCDPRLVTDDWAGGSAKLDACMELISSAVAGGHRVLLFSQFTSMLALLKKRLDEEKISHFTLQGSTTKPVRAELVRRFNDGEVSVFLISLRAGGTGLNLTAADIVIHYDPWWNLAAQNQATDRAYRIGQTNPVQVYMLIAQDTIEERIVELQLSKQALADTVAGGADAEILRMRPDELLQLLEG